MSYHPARTSQFVETMRRRAAADSRYGREVTTKG